MQPHTTKRLLRALAREGLDVSTDGRTWSVRLADRPDLPRAEVLLPAGARPESRALRQLAELAGVAHPDVGRVTRAYASPDMHPGDAGIAIGSVVETAGMLIPAAVGSDINCGMRLHVCDLDLERFLAGDRGGALARSDFDQLAAEVDRVMLGGALAGALRDVPEGLLPADGVVRDGGLGTIGGGNHFVEIQVVDAVLDRARAYAWGVCEGQSTTADRGALLKTDH